MWHFWPSDYMWSYQVMRIIGQSHFGGGQFSEIIQATSDITLGDPNSWYTGWMKIGERALTQAENALNAGKLPTARDAFLRASNYIRTAEFYMPLDDPRRLDTYKSGVEAFRRGVQLTAHPPEVVQVPYENSHLPAYFYPLPGNKPAPTVIMFGGLDSTAEELYFVAVQALRERGMAVLAVDGPGQGGALRLNHIPSRPDYEKAGTAALEWALTQPEVDPDRVAIVAWSMGGYYAPRMAAFEPRFKACGVLGAAYDYSKVWDRRPDNHALAKILQHVLGVDSMPAARERMKEFTLKGVLDRITCPTYILHGEDDKQIPVEHAYQTYEELRCPKWLKVIKAEETGAAHCQADNPSIIHRNLFDWLKDQLTTQERAGD